MANDPAFLAGVKWTAAAAAPTQAGEIPHVTHTGEMNIGGTVLRCYRLSDGRAIFDAEDVHRFFGEALRE